MNTPQVPVDPPPPVERSGAGRNWLELPGSSWLWVAIAVVLGVVGAGLLFLRLSGSTAPATALPSVVLLGKPLTLDEKAPRRALEQLRAHTGQVFSLQLADAEPEQVSFGDLGVEIDKARLVQLLRDTVDPTSPLSRWRRRGTVASEASSNAAAGPTLELPAPLTLDPKRVQVLLGRIKDEFDRPSRDARLDLQQRRVVPSVDGLVLDVDASVQAIQDALWRGATQAQLVVERILPERRTEHLQDVRFDQVLGSFETPYDRALKAEARTYNLRQAASRLDGYVLLPGEVFDFNRVVGPRDEANGYKVAPVIAQGELVDGVGGGTCQISGTLHGAAYFAGLEIVERYPHTRPSSYIKLGLDATVVYPTINFRFKNPFDFPVVLHQSVRDGVVRAQILGPALDQTVTLIRRITGAQPYDQVERPEARLPKGERVLSQRGVPGFSVKMYRILRRGPHAERQVWEATYPPTTQIVLLGTGEAKAATLPKDTHPEYLADELLIMTAELEDGEPRVREQREPGRFGSAGWTEESNMPIFKED